MSERSKPFEPPRISCEVCLKQIPKSEAKIYEAPDYVLHFCGIECFNEWQERQGGDRDNEDKDNKGGPR